MQNSLTGPEKQTYPFTLTDLTKDELKSLIEVLSIESPITWPKEPGSKSTEKIDVDIQRRIKQLPTNLRSKFLIKLIPNSVIRPAILCGTHRKLNPYVINHIFELVKREVTGHLGIIVKDSDDLEPGIGALVYALQSIEAMWWVPSPAKHRRCPPGPLHFQENRCEACILSRILLDPGHILNLRATLLSRTRTGSRHRAPKLLRFVDACINNMERGAFQIFTRSSEMAYGLKAARKLAIRRLKGRGKYGKYPEGNNINGNNNTKSHKSQSILVYMDPDAVEPGESDTSRTLTPQDWKRKPKGRDTTADGIYAAYEPYSKARASIMKDYPGHSFDESLLPDPLSARSTPQVEDSDLEPDFSRRRPMDEEDEDYESDVSGPPRGRPMDEVDDFDDEADVTSPIHMSHWSDEDSESIFSRETEWTRPTVEDLKPFESLIWKCEDLLRARARRTAQSERNFEGSAPIDHEQIFQGEVEDYSEPEYNPDEDDCLARNLGSMKMIEDAK